MGTIEKATDLLFALGAVAEPRSLSGLAAELGLPKPTVHRLLRSLTHRRLVEQDERGLYGLGAGLVTLGLCASSAEPLLRSCQGVLRAHARQLGETFFFVSSRAGELVISSKAEGTGFLRASPRVGSVLPAHATAVGRLFLAFAPELVTLPETLRRYTPCTPVGRALERAVEKARVEGHAVSRDEWQEGLSAVAAPVRVFGHMQGAIALACGTTQLDKLGEDAAAHAVRTAATEAARSR